MRDAIEAEVKRGNVRVLLWLADRLKLLTPPTERTPEQELREILGGLSQDELHEFEGLRDTPLTGSAHAGEGAPARATRSAAAPPRRYNVSPLSNFT